MPPASPATDSGIDPLGRALHLLRVTETLYCRAELTTWGVGVPSLPGSMVLVVVTAGRC